METINSKKPVTWAGFFNASARFGPWVFMLGVRVLAVVVVMVWAILFAGVIFEEDVE